MVVIARMVIVPLCLASLVTGIVQSLGTPWGLFRHHWVVAKLFITVVSTLVLCMHLQPIAVLGASAAAQAMSPHLHATRLQMAVDSGAALLALLVATALGIFKPKGTTRFAARCSLVDAA
ncbi:MAG TPA: hypothetical protein VFK05_21030 [Polyangiaceae bacterium]|nr:hypothetical protein [Polyangiaceae bacterium]